MATKHNVEDFDLHFKVDPITRNIDSKSSGKSYLMQYDHNSEVATFEVPFMVEGHCMFMADAIQVQYENSSKGTSASLRSTYRGITNIDVNQEEPPFFTLPFEGSTWKFNKDPFANYVPFDTAPEEYTAHVEFKVSGDDTVYDRIIFRSELNNVGKVIYKLDYGSTDSEGNVLTTTAFRRLIDGMSYASSSQGSWEADSISFSTTESQYRTIEIVRPIYDGLDDLEMFTNYIAIKLLQIVLGCNATVIDPVDVTPTFSISWPVPETATMFAGSLKFQLKFVCHPDEEKGIEGYRWHSNVNEDISILPGLSYTEADMGPGTIATLQSLEIQEHDEGVDIILDGRTFTVFHGGYAPEALATVELRENKTQTIDESSNHVQYPTARAVYEATHNRNLQTFTHFSQLGLPDTGSTLSDIANALPYGSAFYFYVSVGTNSQLAPGVVNGWLEVVRPQASHAIFTYTDTTGKRHIATALSIGSDAETISEWVGLSRDDHTHEDLEAIVAEHTAALEIVSAEVYNRKLLEISPYLAVESDENGEYPITIGQTYRVYSDGPFSVKFRYHINNGDPYVGTVLSYDNSGSTYLSFIFGAPTAINNYNIGGPRLKFTLNDEVTEGPVPSSSWNRNKPYGFYFAGDVDYCVELNHAPFLK